MAGRAVANRSESMRVQTPRGPVDVVRQQWRSQRAGAPPVAMAPHLLNNTLDRDLA